MNFSLRKKVLSAAGVLIFSCTVAVMSVSAQEDTGGRSIGKFDIDKVRELSTDPKAVLPQTGAITAENVKKETANLVYTVLRIIGSLALIIALVFGVSWLIRRSGLTGSSRIGGGGSMDILEVLPLGQHRNVVLFRVMDTVYLCSQTPSSIELIDKIDGQRAADLLTSTRGTSTVVKFKDAFNQFVSRVKK